MKFLSRLFNKKVENNIDDILNSFIDPSLPQNFGEKRYWVVIKSKDLKSVFEYLNPSEISKSNWENGIKQAAKGKIFIFGPIEEWITLIGDYLPTPNYTNGLQSINTFLNNLSTKFIESQYFLSHRTTDSSIWIKSIKGEINRSYALGDNFYYEYGVKSILEERMKLPNGKIFLEDGEFDKFSMPELRNVLAIAEKWSFNPMKLDAMDNVPNFGYLIDSKCISNFEEIKL